MSDDVSLSVFFTFQLLLLSFDILYLLIIFFRLLFLLGYAVLHFINDSLESTFIEELSFHFFIQADNLVL